MHTYVLIAARSKFFFVLALIILSTATACSQNFGPGYRFDLFKNTPNWELAKAVEQEDDDEIKALLKTNKLNIDLQEPRFGRTLLHLAVGNDKLVSTRVLLEQGARLDIADSGQSLAIHEATKFAALKKNTLQILKLLIDHGADVNVLLVRKKEDDTTYVSVPLVGAGANFSCAKLLLENGADPNVKYGNTYLFWQSILASGFDDEIFVAKYLIVDKKTPVPNPITYSVPNNRPLDIFGLLSRQDFSADLGKDKARKSILDYLNEIDFPKNGAYHDEK